MYSGLYIWVAKAGYFFVELLFTKRGSTDNYGYLYVN